MNGDTSKKHRLRQQSNVRQHLRPTPQPPLGLAFDFPAILQLKLIPEINLIQMLQAKPMGPLSSIGLILPQFFEIFLWGMILNHWIIGIIGSVSKPWYLVNHKIAGKWMFIPLKIVLIGIDPYPIYSWTNPSEIQG